MYRELTSMMSRKLKPIDLTWINETSDNKDKSIKELIKSVGEDFIETKEIKETKKTNIVSIPVNAQAQMDINKESNVTFSPREGKNYVMLYGSLRPDMIQGEEDSENLVCVKGLDLFDTGLGYPAAIELGKEIDEDIRQDAHVYGLICEVDDSTLEAIDVIESAPSYYIRKLVRFETIYGTTGETFIYVLPKSRLNFNDASYIPEGDWLSYIKTTKDDTYRADSFDTSERFLSALNLDEDQIFFNLFEDSEETEE